MTTPMWLVACRQSREIAESFKAYCDQLIADAANQLVTATDPTMENFNFVRGFVGALIQLKATIDKEDNENAARSDYDSKLQRAR